MTAGEAARLTALRLVPVCGDDAHFEANCMVAALLGVSTGALGLHRGMPLDADALLTLEDWTERREKREPLQYILGEWEFCGFVIDLNPAVLIPRPETEELAMRAVELIRLNAYSTALDLCTGSGCIAVAVAKLTDAAVTAADISADAVATAAENARVNEVAVALRTGDLFSAVPGERFDLIVCNPPYLTGAEMDALQPELRCEPHEALFGGDDGLAFYRRIAEEYRGYLNPGGALLLEIGANQAQDVLDLFPGAALRYDLSGNARIIECGGHA